MEIKKEKVLCAKKTGINSFYRAFVRPCNRRSVFFEQSREARRSFGASCAVWLELVSIASCEALDARSTERSVRRLDFASIDEVFVPTELGVDEAPLAS